ncbi:NAD(P)/FAD-dependent oxidoreductase [Trinickia dinghuensis]|uniref:NAD(P)/FAD-dependent oxidoreductase n=1 Tax=Trinickia dinghuensis TaxID=2291023 RepID=A0A3D8JX55_9BURK|nr:NAD(P)/FAD-dependent oxidoreductase [Trinickia dinghuensis]RDU97224.1 NAD(P)/FAD-dependent oxidoreductase [Trinickia dinghuensis]
MVNTQLTPATERGTRTPCIVIVGGGAGGLQLATRLANTVGKRGLAEIVLVDRYPTHFWKPLLHEAASGHRDPATHTIEYAAQARQYGFRFVQGDLQRVDRTRRVAKIGAVLDAEGAQILPARELHYDDLVLAVGSVTNFFNVPGAAEHALPLENLEQAEDFRRTFLAACTKANYQAEEQPGQPVQPVCVNVIGAGATGVELAAALRHAMNQLTTYRFKALVAERDVCIRLIEGGPRILPALDERLSGKTHARLEQLHIDVLTGIRVAEVTHDAIVTATGDRLASDITIWAAGVAGPAMLKQLGDIALNASNQVIVTDTLQTPDDPHIFAFGDCAACPVQGKRGFLPPRAQVAHQQALYLVRAFEQRLSVKPVAGFAFHDAGTVVSLGQAGAVYQTEPSTRSRALIIDGLAAIGLYKFLYRKHLLGLHGTKRTLLQSLSHWLQSRNRPAIKLH